MTELDLYKFIHNNNIEYHIFYQHREVLDMSEFSYDNNDWQVLIFLNFYQLDEFTSMCGRSFFDDGFEIVLKHGYVAINILKIMDYFDISYKNIF